MMLALGAAFAYGVADFVGGAVARRTAVLQTLLWCVPVGLAGLLLAALLTGSEPGGGAALAWGAGSGVAGAVGLIAFYRALARGPMSVVAPVSAVSAAILPVGVGALRGERLNLTVLLGVLLCLAAIGLVSMSPAPTEDDKQATAGAPATAKAAKSSAPEADNAVSLAANSTGAADNATTTEPDSAGAVEPDRASVVELDRAGVAESGRTGAVELDRTGAVEPGRAGAVESGRAGAVEPDWASVVESGRAGAVELDRAGAVDARMTGGAEADRASVAEVVRARGAANGALRAGSRWVLHNGPTMAVLSGAAFGVFFILLKEAGSGSGLWPLVAARAANCATILLSFLLATYLGGKSTDGSRPRVSGRLLIGLAVTSGLLDAAANVLYFLAARDGMLSLAAVLTSLYPAITVLLARIVYSERLRTIQRIGLAIAATGVALVTIG